MRLVPRRRREQVEGRGRRLTTRANLRFGLATLAGGAFEYLYLVRLNPPSASIDVGPPAVAAMIIGLVVLSAIDWQLNSRRLLRPVEAWLEEDRPATEREREAVLRLP